jgi:uncharacterized protein DUF6249
VDDLSFQFFIPLMIFMIPVIAMLGGFVYLIVRTVLRNRVRELEIRERIAMIERGMVPAPEVDPRGFERAMARHATVVLRQAPTRSRSAGVVFMGMGAALMFLIGFAGGEPGAAIGVGGALIIVGLAFFLNGLLSGGRDLQTVERYVQPPPIPPPNTPAASQPEQRLD